MGLTTEQIAELLESKLVNDLLSIAKHGGLSVIDPNAYQKALGIDPYVFRIRLGVSGNTDQIVASLGLPVENSWINQVNFPINPRDSQEIVDVELVDPGRAFTRKEGAAILAETNLTAPTHEHAIRFAEQHPTNLSPVQKPYILFIQGREADKSIFRHLYLHRTTERTVICMGKLDSDYSDEYVLAGLRPRPASW